VNIDEIRSVIEAATPGYLLPAETARLLDACGIPRAGEATARTLPEALQAALLLGFPIVMKVVGPVHKSDVGGVVLNVKDEKMLAREFDRMMTIKETTAILIQPMLTGMELFIGATRYPGFGHVILCGLGGIFIEVLKDVAAGLAPVSMEEGLSMIRSLKSYQVIRGVRGQKGINEEVFAQLMVRLSALLKAAPEIGELDFNPLLGSGNRIVVVDNRIRVGDQAT
jgi:acyl-CoA synthetase (NDP forming)